MALGPPRVTFVSAYLFGRSQSPRDEEDFFSWPCDPVRRQTGLLSREF